MIRIVVTGSECTGKTTLATQLAAEFDTSAVPEYVREFVARKLQSPSAGDLGAIVRGQLELENRALASGVEVVIQDTDLLSTVVYSRHYFGGCPDEVEALLATRLPDLYLLAGIDVPWVPDGLQRDRWDRREEMQGLFEAGLREFGARHLDLEGSESLRLSEAVRAVRAVRSAVRAERAWPVESEP